MSDTIKRCGPEDSGCWLDSARGQYIGEAVQEIAADHGWAGERLEVDHEHYCEAWDEAENWLNEHAAPDGFSFCSNECGDWGLWAYTKECEKCGKEILFEDLEYLDNTDERCKSCRAEDGDD